MSKGSRGGRGSSRGKYIYLLKKREKEETFLSPFNLWLKTFVQKLKAIQRVAEVSSVKATESRS
jgi:hypothetical protein